MKDISAKEQREIFENLGNEIIKGITKSITEMQEYNDKQLEEFEKIFKRKRIMDFKRNNKNYRKVWFLYYWKNRGTRIMNIDNLIKELQQINFEKLTDDELEELAENIEKLTKKIALVMTVRYLVGGDLFNE